MRRIPALLCVAGLATAPASVVAGPSNDSSSTTRSETAEKLVSSAKAFLDTVAMILPPELREHFELDARAGNPDAKLASHDPPKVDKPPTTRSHVVEKLRALFAPEPKR